MVCMSSGVVVIRGTVFSYVRSLFSNKIKAYTGDMAFLIFRIIPHIDSVFRNLTGFCDFFRSTWRSIEIKRDSLLTI